MRRASTMPTLIVTGAGSGIGCETALYFARKGHRVIAAVHSLARASQLQGGAERAGVSVEIIELDVRNADAIARLRDGLDARAVAVDAIVNNAGVRLGGSVEDTDDERVRELFDVNYFGAVRMSRAFLPGMRARRAGRIANVSSITARYPGACFAHYAAAKAALEAFSEGLAQEVAGLGIRVALVVPGQVRTGIFARLAPPDPSSPYAAHQRRLAQRRATLLERACTPGEVAETIEQALYGEPFRFRHLVGDDAKSIWDARTRWPDEAWVECAQQEDDEAYYARMKALWGVDLHRS
jgi:NAD(P)-dependent dehydrogenase (short-subunit alcohol dehydrogenase family)